MLFNVCVSRGECHWRVWETQTQTTRLRQPALAAPFGDARIGGKVCAIREVGFEDVTVRPLVKRDNARSVFGVR